METPAAPCWKCEKPLSLVVTRSGASLCRDCGGSVYQQLSARASERRDAQVVEEFRSFLEQHRDHVQDHTPDLPYPRGEIAAAITALDARAAISGNAAGRLKSALADIEGELTAPRWLRSEQRAALRTQLPPLTAPTKPPPTTTSQVAAYQRDEFATTAFAGSPEAEASPPGSLAQRCRRPIARVVRMSNRINDRVWNARLLLAERVRLLSDRAIRTARFLVDDAPRWLFVTLPREAWHAARRLAHRVFVTLPLEVGRVARRLTHLIIVALPREAWHAARRLAHRVFVTLPLEVGRVARRLTHLIIVALPREAWHAARRLARWLFVTLPREAWRAARQLTRWLFVTLLMEAWQATRRLARWLFVTLPREAWRAARQFARGLFLTVLVEAWRAARRLAHWLFVTLPLAAWRLARRSAHWLVVTLPTAALRVARRFAHWLVVTLPREAWKAVRLFARSLGELLRTLKLGDFVTWALALLISPVIAMWYLLRRAYARMLDRVR